MTTVPYTFGNESSPIPLSQLDANFAVTPNYANTAGNVVNAVQANITALGTLTSLSVAGNVTTGNINTLGQAYAIGNIQGGNILSGGQISSFGAITTNSNLAVGADITVAGVVSAIGTVTAAQVSAVGNVIGGNINTAGRVSAQGNVLAQGQVSATGNIVTAQYFVGNFLGNITGNLSVGGSNTQILFNQNGNVGAAGGLTYNSGSNVLTVLGVISAQSNVIAGNVSLTSSVFADSAQFSNVITAGTPVSSSANNQVATTAFVNSKVGTLGSMATQNANSVSITGGTIANGIITSATISSGSMTGTSISNVSVSNTSISNSTLSNSTVSSLATPLSVTNGGTGAGSALLNAVLLGNDTSAFQTVAPGTNGNVLTSNGTTWASVSLPSSIQGLGYGGSSWHQVSRSFNTTYVNSYSYPIAVSATTTCSVSSSIQAFINGQLIAWYQWQFNGCGSFGGTFIIVPPGATYQLNSGQGVYNWQELY